jgi:2-oxoglutarate ferredoxin oxidoreductase subunit delta
LPKGSVDITYDRCKLCGVCVAVCPTDNLEIQEGRLVAYDRCTGCRLCELHCPDFAIVATREDVRGESGAKKTKSKGGGKKKATTGAKSESGGD